MSFTPMTNHTETNFYLKAKNEIDTWLLLEKTWPVSLILASYLSLLIIDTKYLKNRRPMDLKNLMLAFNLYQVISNGYMFYVGMQPDSLRYLVNHACHPLDPTSNPLWLKGVQVGRLFFISKLVDLMDTVFIVLRKKEKQISFLHLYHHIGMVIYTWCMMKFFLSEQMVIIAVVNSLVHVFMYSYYILSLMGPTVRRHLWWKQYITLIQLAQFVFFMVYMAALLMYGCPQPKGVSIFLLVQGFIFFRLFKNFYDHNYGSKSAKHLSASSKIASEEKRK